MSASQANMTDFIADYFMQGAKSRRKFRVGMEVEHLCVDAEGRRLPYFGTRRSVRSVVEALMSQWDGEANTKLGKLLGFTSPQGKVSLEPGGQVEWSSPASGSLKALNVRLENWLTTFRSETQRQGVETIDEGLDHESDNKSIPWIPKRRYQLMRQRYGFRPQIAYRAMARTAGVHVTLDYEDEVDWRQKFRAMTMLTPFAIALFANSPARFRNQNYVALRPALWLKLDPERCLPPAAAFNPAFGITDWAAWIASVSEILEYQNDRLVLGNGMPYLVSGKNDLESFKLHLSTIFTPVRTDQYLEVRCMDMQTDDKLLSTAAFWYGIMYSPRSLAKALRLFSFIEDRKQWQELYWVACREGVSHPLINKLARQAVGLAMEGLENNYPSQKGALKSLETLDRETFDSKGKLSVLFENFLAGSNQTSCSLGQD